MFNRQSLASDEFSWKKSLSLATASQLAYQENQAPLKNMVTESWGFDDCEVIDEQHTEGFIAWDSQIVLISFRGTESLGDWLADLNVVPKERPYGNVHGGFFQAFEVARARVQQILEQASPSGKKVWITGHSLGGSIAMVAGAELHESLPVTGFYTYGQPKSGNSDVQQFFAAQFAGRFVRFVNDDDIVPQVPPGYSHVGQLVWFDADGDLQRFDVDRDETVEAADAPEPPELDQEEFDKFQQQLRDVRDVTEGDALEFEQSVEGFFPSFSDHAIARYIRKIRRHADNEPELDALLAQDMAASEASEGGLESVSVMALRSGDKVPVMLRVRNSNWEPPEGVEVQSRLGNIVTAKTSRDQVDQLRQDGDVLSIEVSREGGFAELDESLEFIKANDVHQAPLEETGKSAIVAVIDTGADVLHKAFQDENGKTRIIAYWHQKLASGGSSPKDVDSDTYSQSYGRLFTAEDIQAMIDGSSSPPRQLRDPFAHGTHVTSIAAGRAEGSFAGGVAPEAKLIIVSADMNTEPGDPPSIGYSNSHVDALAFIRATADKERLPVAVNVSLGMNAGAHDGSSTLEAGFDAFSGIGRDPGLVVIKSAGNERGHKGHAAVDAIEQGVSEIVWETDSSFRSKDYIEVWFPGFDDIHFTLIDPAENESGTVTRDNKSTTDDLGGNRCSLNLTYNHRDNGDNRLLVTVEANPNMIQQGKWTLRLFGNSLPGGGEVHAWVERDRSRAVTFDSGDNDEMTLSVPGTADTVITVAACQSKTPLILTRSSSWGLTRDGRPKPDLSAPGKDIKAARAGTSDHAEVVEMTGTSMAAPHVTGAVALALSMLHADSSKRQANARQIQRALVSTTKNFTGRHNKASGYGILDVEKFLKQF